jgi:hypothetical protein
MSANLALPLVVELHVAGSTPATSHVLAFLDGRDVAHRLAAATCHRALLSSDALDDDLPSAVVLSKLLGM